MISKDQFVELYEKEFGEIISSIETYKKACSFKMKDHLESYHYKIVCAEGGMEPQDYLSNEHILSTLEAHEDCWVRLNIIVINYDDLGDEWGYIEGCFKKSNSKGLIYCNNCF